MEIELYGNDNDKRLAVRYATDKPVFASLTHVSGRLCRIRDICSGGLGIECISFQSFAFSEWKRGPLLVSIFLPGTDMSILGIPYEIAHSTPIRSFVPTFTENTGLRVGIRFQDLSEGQARLLEELYREHCSPLGD